MSKIFSLREWFYLDDACKHISARFNEQVSLADLLALALDGSIVLSVRFEGSVPVRRARFVDSKPSKESREEYISDGTQYYLIDEAVIYVDGIFTMPPKMGGADLLRTMEWRGADPDFISFHEILIADTGGNLLALVQPVSQINDIDSSLPFNHRNRYHFAYNFPDGSRLALGKQEIYKLESLLAGEINQELTARERTTLLNIIGALLALHGGKEAAVISQLLEKFPDKSGIKQRTLEDKFSQAKKSLRGD